jgi:hypothetical protein
MAGNTWAIFYVDQLASKGIAIYDFLWWVTHGGQTLCEPLNYAHLPPELIPRIEKQLARIYK